MRRAQIRREEKKAARTRKMMITVMKARPSGFSFGMNHMFGKTEAKTEPKVKGAEARKDDRADLDNALLFILRGNNRRGLARREQKKTICGMVFLQHELVISWSPLFMLPACGGSCWRKPFEMVARRVRAAGKSWWNDCMVEHDCAVIGGYKRQAFDSSSPWQIMHIMFTFARQSDLMHSPITCLFLPILSSPWVV